MSSIMHEQDLAIVKGLVSVAWADGKVAAEEMQVIEGLLQAFNATPSEAHEVRLFAKTARTIEDIPLTDLSADDRRVLLHHAVLLSFSDGEQSEEEKVLLSRLIDQLRIPAEEAQAICTSAEENVKAVLPLLSAS